MHANLYWRGRYRHTCSYVVAESGATDGLSGTWYGQWGALNATSMKKGRRAFCSIQATDRSVIRSSGAGAAPSACAWRSGPHHGIGTGASTFLREAASVLGKASCKYLY